MNCLKIKDPKGVEKNKYVLFVWTIISRIKWISELTPQDVIPKKKTMIDFCCCDLNS